MKTREGYYPEQVRNESYKLTLPELKGLQLEVYQVVSLHAPITTEEISQILNKRIHSVTARVFELRELEFIEYCGKKRSEATNRNVSLWRIKENQLKLFDEIQTDK